ncbi:MAG: hypothetical protein JSS61_00710 [Verrucomicrobia bacterium]|nr:hypothetical protein [Verrucomicrobiota bacterium]
MKKRSVWTVSAALLVLSGCASYQATSLSALSSDSIFTTSAENGGVKVVAKAFDKNDCIRYFDRDVLKEGYQPVQIYIENNTEKNFVFSPDRVSVTCAPAQEVADKVHTSTAGRVGGYAAAGLLVCPLFFIPAAVDGIKSSDANKALDGDFASKVAGKAKISPYSAMNKVLFVPFHSYEPYFTITLMEEGSSEPVKLEVTLS